MSEVDTQESQGENKTFTLEEVQSLLEKETAGLKSKVNELLGEKKSAAEKAREEAAARAKAEEDRKKQENDYKSLFESSQQKAAEFEQKYSELMNGIRSEKRNAEALRVATDLASGPNAEILAEFIARRIDLDESNKLFVKSEDGKPTVLTIDDLKKEFVKSGRFNALIDATKATGGGASGNKGGRAASEVSRAEFDAMNPTQKVKFIKEGGKVFD